MSRACGIMKSLLRFLNRIEEYSLVLILLALAFLTTVQVFCRYVLGFSFTWFEEISRYFGLFMAFLGAAIGVKYGTHFSMDLIYERVTNDRVRHGLKILVNLISGLLFFVVAYYGWEQAMRLRKFGALTPVLQVPKYWPYLPIPFFSLIMAVRFLNLTWKHLLCLVRGEPYRAIRIE